jgi:hypothetical protein
VPNQNNKSSILLYHTNISPEKGIFHPMILGINKSLEAGQVDYIEIFPLNEGWYDY